MTELLILLLAVVALYFGHVLGIETGRRQVLDNLSDRIAAILQPGTEFSARHGVRGGILYVDYMPAGSQSGTGYNSRVDGLFVLVHHDDFARLLSSEIDGSNEEIDSEPPIDEPSEDSAIDEASVLRYTPSPELGAVIGSDAVSRTSASKRVWEYVTAQGLRDVSSPTRVTCDKNLRALTGHSTVTMFELQKHISNHLSLIPADREP